MKKRYVILLAVLLMIVFGSFVQYTKPVRPFIQLPGETYPGSANWPIIGPIFGGLTNTFMSSLVAWIVVLVLAVSLKARSRTADEVPTGFYNFFEMIIEVAYNFAKNIAGSKVKDFFPFFMTFLLYILVTNWMGLIPGWDSIGLWENKPHFAAEKEITLIESELETAHLEGEEELEAYVSTLEARFGFAVEVHDGHLTEATEEEILHELEHEFDEQNLGDLKQGLLLIRATEETNEAGEKVKPDDADWTIVPLLRPGATDLNYTLAFAIIAMTMVQFYGIKYLGSRGYFAKFFPFIAKDYGKQVAKNPIKAIDPAVGLLELISEISKIISFAFRLLGNIFAGMVLLFVMAFLVPAANIVFFGLEFFVGLIQALVFALLMLIFMVSATEGHHGEEEHH
ncbi:MAG: F0F1 ATP synthase subunit A [Anaerolineales bacterium]|nr:F0F1 ATP synthase subunit A [Anaerolineales bacterium]